MAKQQNNILSNRQEKAKTFSAAEKSYLEKPFDFTHRLSQIDCPFFKAPLLDINDKIGYFEISPLEAGQGVTLGSTLRRVVLGQAIGTAVVAFYIWSSNADEQGEPLHEFSSLDGLKEDLLEVIGNLQQIRFARGIPKYSIRGHFAGNEPQILTAGMFNFPTGCVDILNKDLYICTIVGNKDIEFEICVETGTGYQIAEDAEKRITTNFKDWPTEVMTNINANFSPVKSVNYKVQLDYDIQGHLSEKLLLTVITDATYPPKLAVFDGIKEILKLFYPLIAFNDLLKLGSFTSNVSSNWNKKKENIWEKTGEEDSNCNECGNAK